MASKQQKKEQKKKQREKEVRQKILARRAAETKKRQEENAEYRRNQRIKKLQKEMAELNQWSDEVLKKVPEKTLTQLEKNVKLLRALEDEYERERASKQQLNESLESEGLLTLEQKMAKLHQTLVDQQKLESDKVIDAIDAKMAVPQDVGLEGAARKRAGNKEVAEVEIVRAPTCESEQNPSNA